MLSVSKLTKLDFQIGFHQSICEIKYSGEQIGIIERYVLYITECVKSVDPT